MILQYEFMQRALLVGFLLAMVIPCIGIVVVNRQSAMIGDCLSHVSLAGVASGLILGYNPIVGSMVLSTLAALSIEGIRKKFPKSQDLATALVMSTGIGLAAVLSDFVPGVANFESFLFGSIVAISNFELFLVLGIALFVILVFALYYNELLYLTVDEVGARVAGISVKGLNRLFTVLVAFTISIASRTVGILMISSLMIVPVATAMKLAHSYRGLVLSAMAFGIAFTMTGLIASFYVGTKPGGSIVLIGILTFLFVQMLEGLRRK